MSSDQKQSADQRNKNSQGKGDDKTKLKTLEPGEDPNDVPPTGVGSTGKSSDKGGKA